MLSPSTALIDRQHKLPIYARERVAHLWLVDPIARTVEVFRLEGENYVFAGAHGGTDRARIEPFEAIELELDALWPLPQSE